MPRARKTNWRKQMTEKTVLLDATQEVVSAHLDLIANGTVAVASPPGRGRLAPLRTRREN